MALATMGAVAACMVMMIIAYAGNIDNEDDEMMGMTNTGGSARHNTPPTSQDKLNPGHSRPHRRLRRRSQRSNATQPSSTQLSRR